MGTNYSLEGTLEMPEHPGYFMSRKGEVYSTHNQGRILKLRIYGTFFGNGAFVFLRNSRKRFYTQRLAKEMFIEHDRKSKGMVERPSECYYAILNRDRVINFLMRFHPEVQIPMTKNSEGLYETSPGMSELGIHICADCGHPNPVERSTCKSCETWMVKPR